MDETDEQHHGKDHEREDPEAVAEVGRLGHEGDATIAPDSAERNIPDRLNDSFHARLRDASRLQCSVLSTWS